MEEILAAVSRELIFRLELLAAIAAQQEMPKTAPITSTRMCTSLAFTPDGKILATASNDGRVNPPTPHLLAAQARSRRRDATIMQDLPEIRLSTCPESTGLGR
jgi:hypothetical protein